MPQVFEQLLAVKVTRIKETDYISLTDIARHRDAERGDYIIQNWMRNRNTIEFLGIWEQLNNPVSNSIEFDGIRNQADLNSFSLTPKRWISQTGAIGILAKTGRYGATFAHRDIAFEFASWVSVEFKLYLIKEFQRLKEAEQVQLGWASNGWKVEPFEFPWIQQINSKGSVFAPHQSPPRPSPRPDGPAQHRAGHG